MLSRLQQVTTALSQPDQFLCFKDPIVPITSTSLPWNISLQFHKRYIECTSTGLPYFHFCSFVTPENPPLNTTQNTAVVASSTLMSHFESSLSPLSFHSSMIAIKPFIYQLLFSIFSTENKFFHPSFLQLTPHRSIFNAFWFPTLCRRIKQTETIWTTMCSRLWELWIMNGVNDKVWKHIILRQQWIFSRNESIDSKPAVPNEFFNRIGRHCLDTI